MSMTQKIAVMLVAAGMFTTAVTNPKGVTALTNGVYKLSGGLLATSMGRTKIAS